MKLQTGMVAVAMLAFVGLAAGSLQTAGACGDKARTSSQANASQGGACMSASADAKHAMTPAECQAYLSTYYQTHGYLGIQMACAGATRTVTKVAENSPAATAGFQPGDVLTAVNGVPFDNENAEALHKMMKEGFKVGDQVHYSALRDSKPIDLQATLVKISDAQLTALVAEMVSESQAGTQVAENLK